MGESVTCEIGSDCRSGAYAPKGDIITAMAIRSEKSHRSILEATMKLLETQSVREVSIERIAREAGVSKTTIYRWWPNKTELIIETFLDNHVARTPIRQDIPAIDALREHMVSLAEVYAGDEGRLVAQLIGECQFQPDDLRGFKERFWYKRRDAVSELVQRACSEGSLRNDLTPEMATEFLYAPIYFQLLFQEGELSKEATELRLLMALDGIRGRAS